MTERTATTNVITAATPLSTAGMISPFAYRTSKASTPSKLMLHRSMLWKELFSSVVHQVDTTENANLERF